MNRLTRANALKIAAVLMALLALFDAVFYEIPALLQGQAAVDAAANTAGGPPFFMVITTFTIDIVAIIAAYGAWNAQRWGVVLLVITAILTTLPGLAGMLLAPDLSTKIMAGIGAILGIVVVVLCLWRERRPTGSSGPA
jgi:hypothetical protein